jgi:putative flippase GtrA
LSLTQLGDPGGVLSAFTVPRPLAAWRAEIGRIVRFCVVGLSNSAITFAAYSALVAAGCPAPAASAAGFALGAANGYRWNSRWTFAADGLVPGTAIRYVAVQALGTALSAAGVAAARGAGLTRLSAEVVILPCVTVVAYCLSRSFVFRSHAV